MVAYARATQLRCETQRGCTPRQGSVCVDSESSSAAVKRQSGDQTLKLCRSDIHVVSSRPLTSGFGAVPYLYRHVVPWRSSRKPSSHRLDMRTVTSKVSQLSLASFGGQRSPSVIFAQHRSHKSPCKLVPRPSLSRLSSIQRGVAARPASRSLQRQVTMFAPVRQAAKQNASCEA